MQRISPGMAASRMAMLAQAEAEAAGACATVEGLAQARQELLGRVERASLDQRRAERKRDAALSQADALRLRSSSLSLLALPPAYTLDPEVRVACHLLVCCLPDCSHIA